MTDTQTAAPPGPLAPDELRRLNAWWRAANYLSVGQIYLLDNPLLREPLRIEHIKPRLLGHWGTTPGLNFVYVHLNRVIRANDLEAIFVTGPGHGGPGLVANTYLEGTYSEVYPEHDARRGGHAAAVQAVLLPRRDPQPRRTRDAGLDPRGRRARLCPGPRLRRGVRQPRSARLLRRRRRRGRDRPAGGQLALQQVPQPRARRRGAADPSPQRLQDRQSDRARAHPARRVARAAGRLRLRALFRRGRRPGDHAPAHGRDARPGGRRHPRDPDTRARRRRRAPALADDRPAHAEGLDRAQGGGRPADGGHLARPPGAAGEARREPRAPRRARGVDARYRPEELFDENGRVAAEITRSVPRGRAPDGRQPARQRRAAAARPVAARLPRLRGRGRRAGDDEQRGHACARRVPARRHARRMPARPTSASSAPTRPPPIA